MTNFEGSSGRAVMLPKFRQNLECHDLYAKFESHGNMSHKCIAIWMSSKFVHVSIHIYIKEN